MAQSLVEEVEYGIERIVVGEEIVDREIQSGVEQRVAVEEIHHAVGKDYLEDIAQSDVSYVVLNVFKQVGNDPFRAVFQDVVDGYASEALYETGQFVGIHHRFQNGENGHIADSRSDYLENVAVGVENVGKVKVGDKSQQTFRARSALVVFIPVTVVAFRVAEQITQFELFRKVIERKLISTVFLLEKIGKAKVSDYLKILVESLSEFGVLTYEGGHYVGNRSRPEISQPAFEQLFGNVRPVENVNDRFKADVSDEIERRGRVVFDAVCILVLVFIVRSGKYARQQRTEFQPFQRRHQAHLFGRRVGV